MSTKKVLSWSLVLVSVMCTLVFLLCVIPYQVLGGLTPCGWLDGILIHTECARTIDTAVPIKIVFTPDGQYIYGTSSGILGKYYLSDGSLAQSMNKSRVDDIALSLDGNKLAVRGNGWGQLWQADNGTPLANFPIGKKEDIDAMAFAPDNQSLAIATQIIGPGFSYRIYFWHIADGNVQMIEGEGCDFGDLNYSPDGTRLVATVAVGKKENCGILIWRVSDQKLLYNLPVPSNEISFSPDSTLLAVGGDYGDISLFQVENGSLVRTMNENSLQVNSVAFSADGQLLASGDICSARLWNPTTGNLLKVFNHGCANSVQSVRFSPDGQFLVTATRMGTVRFFKLPLNNK